jgi:hypothetical protein
VWIIPKNYRFTEKLVSLYDIRKIFLGYGSAGRIESEIFGMTRKSKKKKMTRTDGKARS